MGEPIDACPFVNGSFVPIQNDVAWRVIDLIMTPNTRVKGPNQQAVFQLQPLFAALNQSTNCLVCYSYAFQPIVTVSRLLCNDSTDAYAAIHDQGPKTMQVFMTKIQLPSGYSADYDCNIGLFQHVVMNSTATSTLQCWLRPLVSQLPTAHKPAPHPPPAPSEAN